MSEMTLKRACEVLSERRHNGSLWHVQVEKNGTRRARGEDHWDMFEFRSEMEAKAIASAYTRAVMDSETTAVLVELDDLASHFDRSDRQQARLADRLDAIVERLRKALEREGR